MADLLVAMHVAVQDAKADGKTTLPRRRLKAYRARYDALVTEGQRLNPPPPRTGKAGRPKLGPAGALLRSLQVYADDVLRFATDFQVPFDSYRGPGYADVGLRSLAGAVIRPGSSA